MKTRERETRDNKWRARFHVGDSTGTGGEVIRQEPCSATHNRDRKTRQRDTNGKMGKKMHFSNFSYVGVILGKDGVSSQEKQ